MRTERPVSVRVETSRIKVYPVIGIPFPVSTRIHRSGDYIAVLNQEKKRDIRSGLSTGFS